ncbi:YciI family protein [Pandoraea anhela]|uniref:YCII-related domain-containing protein n=1 Tax=Pandoraea anhela TaxID=2508295 RepID=A0A5E4WEP1_9BURK|nr:YciI family protein [Pandoraea anhela]VVE23302.1 hypothetical protein PAN31108_03245 [Pandoraea anhela]
MIFVIYRIDAPQTSGKRDDFRRAHLDYLQRFNLEILCAGALLGDPDDAAAPGSRPEIGSLYVVDFPSESSARRFAFEDPFHQAGLFASVEVRPFTARLGPLAASLIR